MRGKIAFVLIFLLLSLSYTNSVSPDAEASNSHSVHNLSTGLSYMSIQEAINAPETSGGHTILVDAGTYYESVVVNKSVSLAGADKYTTIIDGNRSLTTLGIFSDGVSISNLTATHSHTEPEQAGGGLWVATVGNVQISDVIACNNDAIGIHLVPGSHDINITRTVIMNNSLSGLLLNEAWKVNVYDSTIVCSNNSGIAVHTGGNHSIIGNDITNNLFGMHLLDGSSNNTISGNTITNNTEGIVSQNSSNLLVRGNIITSNSNVGIHCVNNSMPELHWNDIYGNHDFNVKNDDSLLTVNATYNYWGDGPDLGRISGNVLYDPWLTESIFYVEVASPLSGETVSSTVTISANVNARSGVHKVEFRVDGQLKYTDYDASYAWSWNTTQYAETEHEITARAHDTLGLTVSASIIVFVDNTPPTVSIREPKADNIYYGTINVSVNATDNKGLGNVHARIDDTAWLAMTYDPQRLWNYDLNTTNLSDGQHTLTILALDKAGNPTTNSTTIFTDNSPPTLTIQSPQDGMTVGGTSLVVAVQASDASGILEIEFYLENVLVHTVTVTPYQWSWDTTKYPNGNYSIVVKAYDLIGRVETSETTVTVKNAEPQWWQTHFWTAIEVIIAVGGLLLGILTYLTRRREGKDRH